MGVSPAIFESAGQRSEHYVPGVYGRSLNISSPTGISAGNLCILGKSNGGEPYKLLEFGSIADAQQVLVGGELLDAVGYAFSASNTYVPQRVFAMRVNNGTQASLTLKNNDTDYLLLKSWDWGVHTNQLRLMLSEGTISNSKKLSVIYKGESESVDNIIKPVLSIQYYGDGENAGVSINANSISMSAMSIPEQEETAEEIDSVYLSFSDYDTLESLVAYINNTDVWQATIIGDNAELSSIKLDTVTRETVTETGLTLYSNFDALITALK